MLGACPVTLEDIRDAQNTLSGVIHHTSLDFSSTFSKLTGNKVYLKLENLQKTGSFKIRGAYNKIQKLSSQEKQQGVIAASAGNHAQGVAYAAAKSNIASTIVMPRGAPITKITATEGYGANVELAGDTYDSAYKRAKEIELEKNLTFVHAFDDPHVIAGQGTIGLEIMSAVPEIDIILVPVGGGGLSSGVAIAVKSINPQVKLIGVEAAGAPAVAKSFEQGRITEVTSVNTIADGIAVKRPGTLTFEILLNYVDDIVTVSDGEIAEAMLVLLERSKLSTEGSGAVSLAALLADKVEATGKNIAAIISGGNVDITLVAQIIERGLMKSGRLTRLWTLLNDRPGELQKLLSIVATTGANVISIAHDRFHPTIPITEAQVEITLEIQDSRHIQRIIGTLVEEGYKVKKI